MFGYGLILKKYNIIIGIRIRIINLSFVIKYFAFFSNIEIFITFISIHEYFIGLNLKTKTITKN